MRANKNDQLKTNKYFVVNRSNRNIRQKEMERKRRQILNSAFAIFARKGFSETTVEEIAKHAKVGKGTVFIYFSNKLELLLETFKAHSIFMEVSDSKKLIKNRDDI